MKDDFSIQKRFVNNCLLLCSLFLLLAFSGCGLDTYYSVDNNMSLIHGPTYESTDYSEYYFEFSAARNSNAGNDSFYFNGTEVYYKIYSNTSTLLSNISSISAVNTTSNYNAAAEKMISLGYKTLGTSQNYSSPLISKSDGGKTVYIRLTNYKSETNYSARILVGGSYYATPRRNVTSNSFDFGRTRADSELNKLPLDSDDDASIGTFTKSGVYYVDMYAVASGRDATFTTYYSTVLHLGTVPINSSSEDN